MNKITILIPCYNKQDFLPRLFKNLSKQKDSNFNVLFLDDGSSDQSASMIAKFIQDKANYKAIFLEKNQGLSNARNTLISQCSSEYFYFMDPDDLISKNAMKLFNAVAKQQDFEIIYARYSLIFYRIPIINFLSKLKWNNSSWKSPINFAADNSPFIWNKVFQKQWFLDKGFKFIEGHIFEDIPISFATMMMATKTHYISNKTYKYDLNLKGLSKKPSLNRLEGIYTNLNYLHNLIKTNNLTQTWNQVVEKFFFKNILVHLFFGLNAKFIIKNFEKCEPILKNLYKFFQKNNFESKMAKYSNRTTLMFNSAIKNYFKIKQLIFTGEYYE